MAATRLVCWPVIAMIAAEDPLVAPMASRASAVVPPGADAEEEDKDDALPLPSPGRSLVPKMVNCFPLPPLQREFRNQEEPMASSISSRGTA